MDSDDDTQFNSIHESQTDNDKDDAAVIMLSGDDSDDDAKDPLKITPEDFAGPVEEQVSKLTEAPVAECSNVGDTEIITIKETSATPSASTDPVEAVLKKMRYPCKTFNAFELQLIEYAKKHPILYDTTYSEGNESRRERIKELWVLFSKTFYPNAPPKMSNDSLQNWNRIRLEYFIVHKLKNDYKNVVLGPPLLKYMGKCLNFLKPMYDYIKKCSFEIYYEGDSSLTDTGCLNAIDKPCLFDKIVVAFVKQNRFMYDVRIPFVKTDDGQTLTRTRACRRNWEELAINLNTSRQDCETTWNDMKVKYLKHLINKKRPSLKKPYYQFSFLDEVYEFPKCQNKVISVKILEEKLRNEELFNDSVSHARKANNSTSVSSIKMYPNRQRKRNLNIAKRVVEENNDEIYTIIDEEVTNTDRIEKYSGSETTCNKTEFLNKKKIKLSDGMILEVVKDSRYVTKKKKKVVNKETQSDPSVFLNNINLDSDNFFGEIGKFVSDCFYEEKQRDIRIKSWALITQLELEMLEEE